MDAPVVDTRRATPYVSFQTFLTLVEDLKVNGLPPELDRSAFKKFSGGVGTQLISALKALDLMDTGNRPTEKLARLKDAYGTEEFKPLLRDVVDQTFRFLDRVDLRTATPTMFSDAFRDHTGAQEDVLRKCRTFYLHAAKYLGIELGPRIASGIHQRKIGPNGARRRISSRRLENVAPEVSTTVPPPPPPIEISEKALEYRLVDLMSEAAGDADVLSAIIKVITFLKTKNVRNPAA